MIDFYLVDCHNDKVINCQQSEAGGAGMFYRMLERVRNDGRDSFVRFASLQGPNGRGSGEVALRRGYDDAITPGKSICRLILLEFISLVVWYKQIQDDQYKILETCLQ